MFQTFLVKNRPGASTPFDLVQLTTNEVATKFTPAQQQQLNQGHITEINGCHFVSLTAACEQIFNQQMEQKACS